MHGKGLSGHQSHRMQTDTWLTPPEILHSLGRFDLDPCCPSSMPWKTADVMVSLPTDGLSITWSGRVWCNPPFGGEASKWIAKMAQHGNGIVLVPARTETKMFFEHVWPKAAAILFIRGRPHFHHANGQRARGNSGAPIALIAYGLDNVGALKKSGLGVVVELNGCATMTPPLMEV